MKVKEIPFFFNNKDNQRLFAILHQPNTNTDREHRRAAIVCCYPIFEERLNVHRIMVNFARYAATQGFHVLRFDYFGDGESEGLFEQSSVTTRLMDIDAAVELARTNFNVSSIFLLGARFGGTLCLLYSNEYQKIAGTIAWAPLIEVESYLLKVLRANLAMQVAVHGKVIHDRPFLIRKMEKGETVNVNGYELSLSLFQEGRAIDLSRTKLDQTRPSLIVDITASKVMDKGLEKFLALNHEAKMHYVQIKERKFWTALKKVYPSCKNLFATSLEWIKCELESVN